MKRAKSVLATLGFLSISPFILAQDPNPIPPDSSNILGPDLVAWSEQQKPQPVPAPPPDPPEQQKEKQPATPANPQTEQHPATQSFAGTIIKDHSRYVLKVGPHDAYQLDDQQKAGAYEGREVRVVGTLEGDGHSLRVVSIELIS